jgi:putative membrane protein
MTIPESPNQIPNAKSQGAASLTAMNAPPQSVPGKTGHTSDHLANERTFLAWIRTSISVIGLGFVVAKFSVWLRQLAIRFDTPIRVKHTGLSLPLGLGMMAAGGALTVIAALRYRRVARAIDDGDTAAAPHTITLVTLLVLVITAALGAYMLATD